MLNTHVLSRFPLDTAKTGVAAARQKYFLSGCVGSVMVVDCFVQASTMAAGVSAYLIKTDMSKLGPAEMAQYFEERLGWAVTTAWNLTVKDVEQTISGVCQQVLTVFLFK